MTNPAFPWCGFFQQAEIDKLPAAQALAMLAAIAWADRSGALHPSMKSWARVAHLTPRGLQRAVRALEDKGLVIRTRPSAGGRTSEFRIPVLAENPDHGSGLQPRPTSPQTPTGATLNPDQRNTKPRPGVRGTTKNDQENNQQRAVDVLSMLGLEELRTHPNATPDRLRWIERKAPNAKRSQAGWARDCIVEGWEVPAGFALAVRNEGKAAWLQALDSDKPRQTALVREFRKLEESRAVPKGTTFGSWAFEKYGSEKSDECT